MLHVLTVRAISQIRGEREGRGEIEARDSFVRSRSSFEMRAVGGSSYMERKYVRNHHWMCVCLLQICLCSCIDERTT